jgi:hypothetical protein
MVLTYAGPLASVIDVGCGDLSFWRRCPPVAYTGIDFSSTIIARNQIRFPDRRWICSPASQPSPVSAPVVLCFDVLFHILDETEFRRTLASLCACSEQWIFIYTWHTNPIPALRWQIRFDHLRHLRLRALAASFGDLTSDQTYEKYRNLQEYRPAFAAAGFVLHRFAPYDQIGGMYVFRRDAP